MRALTWTILAVGCADEPDDSSSGDETDTPTDTDVPQTNWGVTPRCDSPDDDHGYNALDITGPVTFVYGSSERDAAFVPTFLGWYDDAFDLTAVPADALSEPERSGNLIVFGSPDTNPLLTELDDGLPVRFDPGSFEFGKYTYAEPGNGIFLLSPNPWGDGTWVALYAGNTFDGAYSTFTIYTGQFDYETTRGRGTLQQEGVLCRDEEPWQWFRSYDTDLRAPWDDFVAGLDSVTTTHHTVSFEPGSDGEADSDWLPATLDDLYDDALDLLEIDALDLPIRTYLFSTRDQKTELTGNSGNAEANDLNVEVHELYGPEAHASGVHEDVHVLAWYEIGAASTALLGEGLAVWVGDDWWGEPLEDWVVTYRDDGSLPSLEDLIEDFFSIDDVVTYPVSGHFVGWLADTYGIDAVKRLYVAPDLEDALADETGLDLDAVEGAWLASLPSR